MNTLGMSNAPLYSRSGKQVKCDGGHFADAIDEDAAEAIVKALNRRPVLRPKYGPGYTRG